MNPQEYTAYKLHCALLASRYEHIGITIDGVAAVIRQVFDEEEIKVLVDKLKPEVPF